MRIVRPYPLDPFVAIDLHCHTIHSDGRDTTEELVRKAKEKCLELVAITDHDRVNREGRKLLLQNNILSPDAVEISVKDYERDHSFHMLYYSLQISERVDDILYGVREGRIQKIKGQCDSLRKNGFEITYQALCEYAETQKIAPDCLNNGILALFLMRNESDRKNAERLAGRPIPDLQSFIDAFLKEYSDFPEVGYVKVEDYEPSVNDIAAIAKSEWGLLSVAHPNFSFARFGGVEGFEKTMREYQKKGIEGVECNVYASPEWIQVTSRLEKEVGIILTFGSDYHGDGNSRHAGLGTLNPEIHPENSEGCINTSGILERNSDAFIKKVFHTDLPYLREALCAPYL